MPLNIMMSPLGHIYNNTQINKIWESPSFSSEILDKPPCYVR